MKRTPLKRTGRISPVSKRRRARDASYPSSRTAIYERAEGMCEARCTTSCAGDGHQVHHVAGRGGPDPHRLDNLKLVCAACHEWVHQHPEAARRQGLMATRHGGAA